MMMPTIIDPLVKERLRSAGKESTSMQTSGQGEHLHADRSDVYSQENRKAEKLCAQLAVCRLGFCHIQDLLDIHFSQGLVIFLIDTAEQKAVKALTMSDDPWSCISATV